MSSKWKPLTPQCNELITGCLMSLSSSYAYEPGGSLAPDERLQQEMTPQHGLMTINLSTLVWHELVICAAESPP